MATSGLGNLLVQEGLLSEQDRITLRKTSGASGGAFAKGVLALGVLDEAELAYFLGRRTSHDLASANLVDLADGDALTLLDPPILARLEVLPLRIEGERLITAMLDPLDRDTIRQVEFFTGYRVDPVIATLSQIRRALERIDPTYKPSLSELEELITNHVDSAVRRAQLENGLQPAAQGHTQPITISDDGESEEMDTVLEFDAPLDLGGDDGGATPSIDDEEISEEQLGADSDSPLPAGVSLDMDAEEVEVNLDEIGGLDDIDDDVFGSETEENAEPTEGDMSAEDVSAMFEATGEITVPGDAEGDDAGAVEATAEDGGEEAADAELEAAEPALDAGETEGSDDADLEAIADLEETPAAEEDPLAMLDDPDGMTPDDVVAAAAASYETEQEPSLDDFGLDDPTPEAAAEPEADLADLEAGLGEEPAVVEEEAAAADEAVEEPTVGEEDPLAAGGVDLLADVGLDDDLPDVEIEADVAADPMDEVDDLVVEEPAAEVPATAQASLANAAPSSKMTALNRALVSLSLPIDDEKAASTVVNACISAGIGDGVIVTVDSAGCQPLVLWEKNDASSFERNSDELNALIPEAFSKIIGESADGEATDLPASTAPDRLQAWVGEGAQNLVCVLTTKADGQRVGIIAPMDQGTAHNAVLIETIAEVVKRFSAA